MPCQSFGSQHVGEDRAGNAGRWSTQVHLALPRRLPASSPLHLSGSSERGQPEHNAGPALQDCSHGAPVPGQSCCVMALMYCFLLFNFPSRLSSVVWDKDMRSGNSSVLVLYLLVSSKEDRDPFHHSLVQHQRERLVG